MKYLKKHSTIVTFLISLLIIGVVFGIVLGFKQDTLFKKDIIYSLNNLKEILLANKINNIFVHLITFLILIITSFLVPLFFVNFVLLFFKGVTIGFSLYIFAIIGGGRGLIFGLIYVLLTSSLFCFIYIFLIIRGINLNKNIISLTLTREKKYISSIKNTLTGIFIIIGICSLYDILLFAFSNFIISKFIWLF